MKTISPFVAGSSLPLYYQFISTSIRNIYFSNVSIIQPCENSLKNTRPTLILCSHRNSAFDGYIALRAFPKAQALASIQLLNSHLMRIFFTGIPVVRKKDRQRFSISSNAYSSPSEAAITHIKSGGSLLLFPEGSSEWGFKPLPYQRGAARIIRCLLDDGIEFDIIPMGLFYVAPDKFNSDVEIYVGEKIKVNQQNNFTTREWERNIHSEISIALNEISVNCPDIETFEQATLYAYKKKLEGDSYAKSFIDYQNNNINFEKEKLEKPSISSIFIWRFIAFCLMFILFPILLSSYITSSFADARNTVSFFKIVGGSLAAFIWLPILLILLFIFPKIIGASIISAFIGFFIFRIKGANIC